MIIEIGEEVIAKRDKCEVISAGMLYIVESNNHPALGNCGLIKLKGVRDYWNQDDFVPLRAYTKDDKK